MARFFRPSTIRGALLPVMLTNWMYSVGVIEYPQGRPRPFVSACWSLLHIAYFLSVVMIGRILKFSNLNGSMLAAGNLRAGVMTFLIQMIICQVSEHVKAKELRNVVRKIANINAILKSFGISEEYDAIFNTQLVELGIGIVVEIVIVVVYHFRPKDALLTTSIFPLLFVHYMSSFCLVRGWCLSTIVRYVRSRFKQLNDYIVQENGPEETKNGELWRSTMVARNQVLQFAPITYEVHGDRRMIDALNKRWMFHVIREMRKTHRDMVNLMKELNGVHAIQILISTLVMFSIAIMCAYNLYFFASVHPDHDKNGSGLVKISIFMFTILYIGKQWEIVHACSTTSNEAQRTGKLIHELVNPNSDEAFRNEVRLFALQLMQNPLHFSVCGFFNVDYELFQRVMSSIVTYLVILIQMRNIWDAEVVK